MADLAKVLLRKKIPELKLALEGKFEEHHRSCWVCNYADSRQWKKIFAFSSSASREA